MSAVRLSSLCNGNEASRSTPPPPPLAAPPAPAVAGAEGISRLRQLQPDQPVERRMIGQQGCRGAVMDDAAAFEDDGVLRQRQCNLDVLLDQDEGVGAL